MAGTLYQTVRVRAQAEDIVLCYWARHFTLTVLLSTQVYKWVMGSLILGGNSVYGKGYGRNVPSCFILQKLG